MRLTVRRVIEALALYPIGMTCAPNIPSWNPRIFARHWSSLLDADFHALLATSGERDPSVVRVRKEGLDGNALAALLQAVWPRIESGITTGAMVTITDRSVRIRRLPIMKG